MNKYLVKIAKKADKEERGYALETIGTAGGAGLAKHQYHEGHLTGRATYYHGSTVDVANKIKKEGIVPRASKGIIDEFGDDFAKKNEGLAFATRTKSTAHFYAEQAKHIQGGKYSLLDRPKHLMNSLHAHVMDSVGLKKDKGVTKLNIPTWKDEVKSKTVENPELKHNPFLDPGTRHELGEKTLTHKGVIPPKFVNGSKHYEKNTLKEIKEYIKGNKGRFAKGVGKVVGGTAIAGLSAYSAYDRLKKKDE